LFHVPSLYSRENGGTGVGLGDPRRVHGSYNGTNLGDDDLLEIIVRDRQKVQASRRQNEGYAARILWRPRGVTLTGDRMMFERRTLGPFTDFALADFNLREHRRTLKLLAGFEERRQEVATFLSNELVTVQAFSRSALPQDGIFRAPRGLQFAVLFSGERLTRVVKITCTDTNGCRLLAVYPFRPAAWLKEPVVAEVFSFDEGHGFAAKLACETIDRARAVIYQEDVLVVNERFFGPEYTILRSNALQPERGKETVSGEFRTVDMYDTTVEHFRVLLDGALLPVKPVSD